MPWLGHSCKAVDSERERERARQEGGEFLRVYQTQTRCGGNDSDGNTDRRVCDDASMTMSDSD